MPLLGFGIIKVKQGHALIVSRVGSERVTVSFTGRMVWPVVHKAEMMDISVKTIEIDRRGSEGLICRDNIRADIKVTFFVRVNKTVEDVIKVAQAIGCERASDIKTLEELFSAKFSEALKTVGKQLDFVDLYTMRNEFRDQIIEVIGTDLNGYVLEDAAIDYLEQTPLTELDEFNILDAQGIRKITELTAIEHVRTNEYQNTEKKQITKQDVEAAEAIFELERQKAEALARQQREIQSVQAREQADTLKVQAEEHYKAEQARLKTEEAVAVQQENLNREVEVAAKNRERVVAVETERVEKDRLIEVISRERETELQRIAKEKEVEHEKRDIANVIRERVAVDRTVAEKEEEIKRLRLVEEADRTKQAKIITAEGDAQEMLVKDIKAAEAAEKAAEFKARELLVMADAELQAAEREAKGKIRLSEGIQAETAASGLAAVEVKDRDADATEKMGLAEARVLREQGLAEGAAIEERLKGEAAGLTDKAAAMKALDDASRDHEEYRLRLEARKEIELSAIDNQRQIAEAQAEVIAKGLENAKIDIVGGESVFFDRLVGAMSAGRAVDGFVNKSSTVQTAFSDYLDGDGNFGADLKDVLSSSSVSSEGLQNLTVSALLMKLMASSRGETKLALGELAEAAQKLGLDKAKLSELGS